MTNIDKYRKFCQTEEEIPLFSQSDWLDNVCGKGKWDVVLVEKGNKIVATMPYYKSKKMIFDIVSMPKLTQTMGPYIVYPKGQKYDKKLSYEKEIMMQLIDQLPEVDFFFQNFHARILNWLPFKWRGFEQSTYYTYVLEDLSDLNSVFQNFRSNIKTDIRKAQKVIKIAEEKDLSLFYQINKMTFDRQKIAMPYSLEWLTHVDNACQKKNRRKIFMAYDNKNNLHAAIYVVWDRNTMYYLMGGGNPRYRNSGATSLLLWEAIQLASQKKLQFDFEGSMLEPVERFFRAFGATQIPYFRITKSRNRFIKLMIAFYKGRA
jgi:hypothetical protein